MTAGGEKFYGAAEVVGRHYLAKKSGFTFNFD
jgi:hypothetical protein